MSSGRMHVPRGTASGADAAATYLVGSALGDGRAHIHLVHAINHINLSAVKKEEGVGVNMSVPSGAVGRCGGTSSTQARTYVVELRAKLCLKHLLDGRRVRHVLEGLLGVTVELVCPPVARALLEFGERV